MGSVAHPRHETSVILPRGFSAVLRFFESQKSCDGVRNARFQERMGKRNERVFPAKISPKDSSCFKSITDPGPERDRCVMVQCYRELVEKNCRAVVSQSGQSKVEDMRLHEKCL